MSLWDRRVVRAVPTPPEIRPQHEGPTSFLYLLECGHHDTFPQRHRAPRERTCWQCLDIRRVELGQIKGRPERCL